MNKTSHRRLFIAVHYKETSANSGGYQYILPNVESLLPNKKNMGSLEELIDNYKLRINNNPDHVLRPSSQGSISIIDLPLTSPGLSLLYIQKISEEYLSLSDHELILLGWEAMEREIPILL